MSVQDAQASLTIFLMAELADESRAALKRFSTRVACHPAVVEAYYVAGEADVLLKLRLPDMAAYDRFVETYLNASALVRRFKDAHCPALLGAAKGRLMQLSRSTG